MKYEAQSEFGVKRFRKIEPMRDWLWQFFPYYLNRIKVFRIRKDGTREVGSFVNNKKVVVF